MSQSKVTLQDIIDKFEELDYGVDALAYGIFDDDELGFGEFENVAHYGGEDCGSTWYQVWYVKDHDIYIRVDGWYQSYHGTEFYNGWDDVTQVKPQKKEITVYE